MDSYTIGQVAAKAQVNIETIRFYERKGLIQPAYRKESGYRIFTEDTINRIRFIKRAKELGFTLKEISELLSLHVSSKAKCGNVKKMADARIKDIEKKLEMLGRMKHVLVALSDSCRKNRHTSKCPILEALDKDGTS